MYISKLLPAICAVAVCTSFISVRAQDNPAQAAARAALMQKMGELDAADGTPPAIVVTPSGATMEKPTPPAIQTPPPAPTLPVTPATNETEMQTQSEAQKATVLAEEKKAAAEAQQSAKAQKAAAAAEKKRAAAEKAAMTPAKLNDLGLQPIQAPALPISEAKQEQLQALLVKYKADQISSAEYQTQRAAILAEP